MSFEVREHLLEVLPELANLLQVELVVLVVASQGVAELRLDQGRGHEQRFPVLPGDEDPQSFVPEALGHVPLDRYAVVHDQGEERNLLAQCRRLSDLVISTLSLKRRPCPLSRA